jgi:uncharacterized protein YdaU (DUF1376 family)
MDRAPWHIPDWLAGTEELSKDAEFAYFRLCLFIYQFDGLLKDDDRANARRCKMSTRCFRQVKAELLTATKIEIRDGYVRNRRCERVLSDVCSLSEAQSRRAHKRWAKARESGLIPAEIQEFSADKQPENSRVNGGKPNEINGTTHTAGHAGNDAISEARNTRKEESSLRSASSPSRERNDDRARTPAKPIRLSSDREDLAYDALERLLDSPDWSLRKLANECGGSVSHGHVGKINRGQNVPEPIRLSVLATALRLAGELNI